MAGCVFLGDVFIRRVSVNFAWLPPLLVRLRDFVLRRQPAPAQPQYIERLKSRKAEVAGHLEQLRAATRFELPAANAGRREAAGRTGAPRACRASRRRDRPWRRRRRKKRRYTERLLKAKKKAWEERKEQ